ncbi:hypothetical protein BC830DRAFT_1126669 [Chytriomyces sp. MP71]|nr:hypothetical protein BC830DRAFT_1126669 [Chytriomyces sp. MP71]
MSVAFPSACAKTCAPFQATLTSCKTTPLTDIRKTAQSIGLCFCSSYASTLTGSACLSCVKANFPSHVSTLQFASIVMACPVSRGGNSDTNVGILIEPAIQAAHDAVTSATFLTTRALSAAVQATLSTLTSVETNSIPFTSSPAIPSLTARRIPATTTVGTLTHSSSSTTSSTVDLPFLTTTSTAISTQKGAVSSINPMVVSSGNLRSSFIPFFMIALLALIM